MITGLPGSGKSTLMRRAVTGPRVDSQDTRDRWDARTPRLLPYALYRPLVRLAHYAGLRRALRTGEGVVVHDCGTNPGCAAGSPARPAAAAPPSTCCCSTWPPRPPARASASAAGASPRTPSAATAVRPPGWSPRSRRASRPCGCGSATLLDRPAADALRRIAFTA